jgi:hypothetical protein
VSQTQLQTFVHRCPETNDTKMQDGREEANGSCIEDLKQLGVMTDVMRKLFASNHETHQSQAGHLQHLQKKHTLLFEYLQGGQGLTIQQQA